MPQPVLIGATYYLRVHVPRDVVDRAKGTTVSLPIGDRICQLRLTTHAKTSLRTKDWQEAKRRFSQALAALESHWEALRCGPADLTHKQAVALAGEVVADFLDILEDEPGSPELWERVAELDEAARAGRSHPLAVPTAQTRAADIESRFGGLADAALARRGLLVDAVSRSKLLQRVYDKLRQGDVLLVRWVDRLGRNYQDVTDTIRDFMRRGVVIRTVINNMTFDGATTDPMQEAVRDALIAFMAATAQAQAEVTKEAQKAGIEASKGDPRKYRGRKPSYDRETLERVQAMLAEEASISAIARVTGLSRQAVLRIKDDPVKVETAMAKWAA